MSPDTKNIISVLMVILCSTLFGGYLMSFFPNFTEVNIFNQFFIILMVTLPLLLLIAFISWLIYRK